ncbi:terpenoid cyclases/Protein prenyltransferase [Amylocystis lapponica]|nr:terpenoid cyclases/Protein prenyltransferase [Amylocystis lapponica]
MASLRPTPTDGYPSPTSDLQYNTENILKSHLPLPSASKPGPSPVLHRNLHLQFLLRNLLQGFPERYVSQDASQPWLIFWTLQGFSVLGVGLDDQTKKRARQTLLALQHPEGGFAGGPGQAAHLLPTYAAVCAFAIVGQQGEGGGWEGIDRKKMYDFFMSLKQPDGSFLVSHYGEVDVRGLYCLMAVATLLDLLTPELLRGVPEFVASCQTYEGGFGNASFPGWAFQDDSGSPVVDTSAPRPVLGEAHGGYTFCATATWVLLQPYLRLYYSSHPATPAASALPPAPTVDVRALTRWLVQMQGTPIELGGFRGRTNKLVDGCYSWWVAGCFALVAGLRTPHPPPSPSSEGHTAEEGWADVDDAVFGRGALQEYLLYAGQHPAGGLRDKPPKPADAYHTLYCLSGLAACGWTDEGARRREVVSEADAEHAQLDALRREAFVSALCWLEEEGMSIYVGGEDNRLNATHPLFDLTVTHSEAIMAYFYGQSPPARRPKPVVPK